MPQRVQRILKADWDHPFWELGMARKDARLMLEAAAAGGQPLTLVPAIAAVMDAFLAEGHGQRDWTVLAKDLVR